MIHNEILKAIGPVTNRGKKSANFAVLRETKMPAILTEVLFIDNAADASKLNQSHFLEIAARGHAEGISKAFNLQEKALSPTQEQQAADNKMSLAIQHLQQAGIINTADYWLQNAKHGGTVRGDYVAALIVKMAKQLKR